MRVSNTIFPPELQSSVEKSMVAASRLEIAQFRLDAPTFLSHDKFSALIPSLSQTCPLSELADVFTVYIQSPVLAYVRPFAQSRPYMTTSELAEYQTGRMTHVSLSADPRLIDWEIKRGNIIVSRSGRVGEAYWVDKKLDGALVGDSFRVVPKNPVDGPYIYAVLSSSFARNLLSGSAYGSVVDHASLDQLRNFPIPQITATVRSKIASIVGEATGLREAAYDLLDQAQDQLLKINRLSPLEPSDTTEVATYKVTSADVARSVAGASEYRLEAHFHNPVARKAITNIEQCPSIKSSVGRLSRDVIMGARFKRNYVEASYGTPFLSGRNIVQIRPSEVKHLSIKETNGLKDMLVSRGWILITCSGTIGRTSFVWHNFENFAASQHILRAAPNEEEVDPAYLYAFLSSEYGYEQIIRFRHGSVIDEVTDEQLKKVIVPIPSPRQQKEIGDLIRRAYEMRAEALRLEDEAQTILIQEINEKEQSNV